jgi:hypothetical protein
VNDIISVSLSASVALLIHEEVYRNGQLAKTTFIFRWSFPRYRNYSPKFQGKHEKEVNRSCLSNKRRRLHETEVIQGALTVIFLHFSRFFFQISFHKANFIRSNGVRVFFIHQTAQRGVTAMQTMKKGIHFFFKNRGDFCILFRFFV